MPRVDMKKRDLLGAIQTAAGLVVLVGWLDALAVEAPIGERTDRR